MRAWKITLLTTSAALIGALSATLLQHNIAVAASPEQLSAVTVTAERFVLVDRSGARKAELGIVGENRNWHGCYSGAPGTPVSTLSGPGLVFYAMNNKPVLVLHSTEMATEISICNAEGKVRAEIGVFEDNPHLRLFARDGIPSLTADLNSEGSYVSLYDPRTKGSVPRVLIQAGKSQAPSLASLIVLDEKGGAIWRAP
jgi:hypothetical protein